jgi:dihydrofolate reductase
MEIIAIAATSLDGFITRGDKPGTAFTSEADKAWFPKTLQSFDFKIMGRKTFEVSKDYLLPLVQNNSTDKRMVMTSRPEAFNHMEVPNRLEFTAKTAPEIATAILESGMANPKVAILGGSFVYSAFLAAGLINEFWITVEPLLFGSGTPLLISEPKVGLILNESSELGSSTLLLKYRCEYRKD